jgi:hypothetical protein
MNKIILSLSLAAASMIFAGCTKEVVTSEITGNPNVIGFDLNTGKTRATVSNLATLQGDAKGIGVFATKSDGEAEPSQVEYIDNEAYVYDSKGGRWAWKSGEKQWPTTTDGYPMNFYAWYPYDQSSIYPANIPYEVIYYIDTDPSKQIDLLAANKLNVTTRPASSNVSLDFKHILSQIKFQVVVGDGLTANIFSVKLKNVSSGHYFNYETMEWSYPLQGRQSEVDFPYISADWSYYRGDGITPAAIPGDSGSLMLIPQYLSPYAWDKSVEGIADQSYIEVIYNIPGLVGYEYDVYSPYYREYPAMDSDPQYIPLYVKVGYPLDTNWEMGKSYTYTIHLDPLNSSGGYLVDDNFYTEYGQTLLPVIDPQTGEGYDVGEPIFSASNSLGCLVSVGEWQEEVTSTEPGPKSGILYMDGDRLAVGQWGEEVTDISNMVFTKFGSTIGFTGVGEWDDTASILFDPSALMALEIGIPYEGIPEYDPLSQYAPSDPRYHDFPYGQGDICKLVGLTSAKATEMNVKGTLSTYHSGWRLPTNQENEAFIRGTSTWTANDEDALNPGIRTFADGTVLPAAGYRDEAGLVLGTGTYGSYCSSTPSDYWFSHPGASWSMSFAEKSCLNESIELSLGMAVRCVRP